MLRYKLITCIVYDTCTAALCDLIRDANSRQQIKCFIAAMFAADGFDEVVVYGEQYPNPNH